MINKLNLSNIVYILILVLVDFLVLIIALDIAFYIRSSFFIDILPVFETFSVNKYYWVIFLILLMFIFEKIYIIRFDFWSDTKRILKGLFLSYLIILTVITLSKMSSDYSRSFITTFFIISIVLIPIFKRYLKRILFSFDFFKINVRIIGKSELLEDMKKELNKNWYFGYKTTKNKFKVVIIISKNFSVEQTKKLIRIYSKKTKNIYVVPYMYHLDFSHANIVDYFNIRLSAICMENRLLNYKNILIKTLFEKILVICILPLGLLLHMFLMILIKRDSKGTVLFKQKRLGEKGKNFSCYKYRTMHENSNLILEDYLKENPEEVEYYNTYHKYKNDPRITKIGNFLRATSLDEFPQFFNVLRGDMNLIGPRPYMIKEKTKIGIYNENLILKVKPGITGLWQVSGRNELTFHERVELDTWYIQNWSLWMDFVIFMKTIKVVLSKVGAR